MKTKRFAEAAVLSLKKVPPTVFPAFLDRQERGTDRFPCVS